MRYLAIDPGEKRVGLAVGDDETGIVTPLAVVRGGRGVGGGDVEGLVARVRAVAEEQEAGALVVGLPLNMDGTEGPGAKASRALAGSLREALGVEVHLFDERLSSERADELLRGQGLTRGQRASRHDAVAAGAILLAFFERGG